MCAPVINTSNSPPDSLKKFDQIKIWLHPLNNIVLVGMASAGQNLQYWDWDQGEFDINTLQHALPL